MMTDVVRVPSPKKRTPRISVPSVTPVAAKMIRSPDAEVSRAVHPLEIGDAHQAAIARRLTRTGASRSTTSLELGPTTSFSMYNDAEKVQ